MSKDMSPSVQRRLQQYLMDFLECDAVFNEQWTLYPEGKPVSLNVRYSGIKLDDGRIAMLCEGSEAEKSTPEATRGRDALMHTRLKISLHQLDGGNLYLNPSARQSLNSNNQGLSERFVSKHDYKRLMHLLEQNGEANLVAQVHTSAGICWDEMAARLNHDPVTGNPSILVSATDVSKLKEAEALASRRALVDSLTNLPNRHALPKLFNRCIKKVKDKTTPYQTGALFVDLDEFKAINDTLGHAEGDRVLVEVSKRLSSLCGPDDCVVRLGGDEFFVITSREDGVKAIHEFSQALLDALAAPISLKNTIKKVTPSIGVALYPEHGDSLEMLMQSADIAMYKAKKLGRNQFSVFSNAMRDEFEYEHSLYDALRDAISNNELVLHYQSRISANCRTVTAMEALLRWQHPEYGLMLPDTFIPLAERSGLISKIGTWVLQATIQQIANWQHLNLDVIVSVNISVTQLCNADFVDTLEALLTRYGCLPNSLELELSEPAISKSDDVMLRNIAQLRYLGVRVSVDDFGMGYSNLARLNELSFDWIKIDRSLIANLPYNSQLVKMTIDICKLMKARIVAEGVENEDSASWLYENGCDELQGYLFSRPLPVEQATNYLQDQTIGDKKNEVL